MVGSLCLEASSAFGAPLVTETLVVGGWLRAGGCMLALVYDCETYDCILGPCY